jgi:hypothetical protein
MIDRVVFRALAMRQLILGPQSTVADESISDSDSRHRTQDAKRTQDEENHDKDDHHIQDFLDGGVHRNIVIDRPQQHAEDDQDDH